MVGRGTTKKRGRPSKVDKGAPSQDTEPQEMGNDAPADAGVRKRKAGQMREKSGAEADRSEGSGEDSSEEDEGGKRPN
jgi:hypothetical protein